MAPQTFSTHLRDSNGNVVADVFVEISEAGIKLEGQAGVLGQFPFQRVLQWAVTEPECFTFTVITEEGRKDVTLWSSGETIQALLRAVEDTVQHLLALKRAQKGGKGQQKGFKSMVDNIVGANRAVDAMGSPGRGGGGGGGGGLFSPATRPVMMSAPGGASTSNAGSRYPTPPGSPQQMSPRGPPPPQRQPASPRQQMPRSPPGPAQQQRPMQARGMPPPPPPQQQRPPTSFQGAAHAAHAAGHMMRGQQQQAMPRSPPGGARPPPPGGFRYGGVPAPGGGSPSMMRAPAMMYEDHAGMSPAGIASVQANQQLEMSLVQSRQYSDRMRAALAVREQELTESRRREEDAMRAANEAVAAQRNLDLTLKEMQRMFAAKEGQIQKLEQQHKQVQAAIALSAGAGAFGGGDGGSLREVQNEYRQLKAEISKLASLSSSSRPEGAAGGGDGKSGPDVDTLRGEMLDLSSQLVLEETRSRQALDELVRSREELKEKAARLEALEGELKSLGEKLDAKTSELRAKERQLLAYEESMVNNLGALGQGGAAAEGNKENASGNGAPARAGDGPLAQLKALMGEAYLLKMALKKQQADAGGESGSARDISAALDAWIYSSHNLRKVCTESGTGAFAQFTSS